MVAQNRLGLPTSMSDVRTVAMKKRPCSDASRDLLLPPTLPLADIVALCQKQESPLSGGFSRLRGKDSNLDYLIQSQASYH
jgi:hypothetical protein